jgi:hypothetical protein
VPYDDDGCVWGEDTQLVGIGKDRRSRESDGEASGIDTARGRRVPA